ncbi:MAG: hypothetical protein JOS17DRAFT_395497 [Linnemannia elongata]|nr:MAG: hypothetical protein JOS17DRAFT_395497 [Linnemannia elongata]
MYAYGKSVPKDEVKALLWYLKAASQGDRRGQTLIAQACEHDYGTPKSDHLALQWYLEIAETGSGDDQRKVAEFYRDGRCGGCTPHWDRLAKKWYDAISEQDKGFNAQRETIDAWKELMSDTLASSHANDNYSKDGYEFSSNDPYCPPLPPQSSYTYESQYEYSPPIQPMYDNGYQPTNPYEPQPAQRVYPHQLDRVFIPQAQPVYPLQLENPFSDPFGSPSPFGP